MPEDHAQPMCAACGKEFASTEQLGKHMDAAHRQQYDKEEDENPSNIGPGVTEQYKNV